MNRITREIVKNNLGTIQNPTVGDIRHGFEIGKYLTNLYIYHACPNCAKKRWVVYILKRKSPITDRCRKCSSQGELNSHWKGGKSFHKPSGYIILSIYPNSPYYEMGNKSSSGRISRLVPEHRVIMAQHIGRCLAKNEEVHHKNGIKTDNRIENLELTLHSKHIKDHHKGYTDGYAKGLIDGQTKQIQELKYLIEEQTKQIKLLQWRIKEGELCK